MGISGETSTGSYLGAEAQQAADFPRIMHLPAGYNEQRRSRELRLYEGGHYTWPHREVRMDQDSEKAGGLRAHSSLRLRTWGLRL